MRVDPHKTHCSTLECLLYYASTLPTEKSKVKAARQPMADACRVSTQLVYRWLTIQMQPIGLTLIRLRYFFHDLGFKVSELKALSPTVFQLGRVIVDDKVSIQQACEELGYSSTDSVYPLLNGVSKPSKAKEDKIRQLIVSLASDSPVESVNVKVRQEYDVLTSVNSRQAITDSLRSQVEAILPLAQAMLSDNFSDEDRRQLRRSIPDDGLYRAAQALHGLCSKESRKLALKRKRGE